MNRKHAGVKAMVASPNEYRLVQVTWLERLFCENDTDVKTQMTRSHARSVGKCSGKRYGKGKGPLVDTSSAVEKPREGQ